MQQSSFYNARQTKWRAIIVLSIGLVLTFLSCRKVDKMELDKGDTALSLSADKAAIVLEEKNSNNDAINFNWTTGSNHNTNSGISYKFIIDKLGNNFSHAVTADMGKGVLTKKFTVKELNDLAKAQWNLSPGVEASLEAKVVLTVTDQASMSDSSASIVIKITPYMPVTTTLFLIGDAAPNGWNAGQATALTLDVNQPGKFTWQGPLRAGDFKFITVLGQFSPSYNKGAGDNKLVYRTLDTQPDDKFIVAAPGVYDVVVDLLNLTVNLSVATSPPYTRLWMLGDAVPTGWNIDNPSEMRVDSSNLFVFTYNEILAAGEFKIPVATGNFGTDYYMPLVNHQALTEEGVQLVTGGSPDNKWQVTTPGAYKIKLDLQTLKMSIRQFTPYTQVWMVGDATPVGWNIDTPQPMVPTPGNPYEFTYTGQLNPGEFKLPLATGNFGCDYFMPVLNASGPGSMQMKFVAAGNPDFKWKIALAGTYKVTINQLYETISIVKQ